MRISENWLREWVDPDMGTAELAETLTMAGLEVDSVEPAAPPFEGVVVAEILDCQPHPDADKLRVCRVAAGGDEPLQIVCGAPNARAGLKAPLATVGGRMPDGTRIKRAKLRGVASSGMLCSARELGLSEEASGLMELPADAPVGADLRDWLQLDDSIIEIDLTPNRGDCLGMEGVAREIGALTSTDVKGPEFRVVVAALEDALPITVAAPQACPRYLGRVIRGIDPAARTPLWMQERLRRGGIRSLGPLVDVTNYVMLELGQPMHAFDLARLAGGIEVRHARPGETLTLLDESVIELDEDTLLIADAEKPLALAGIMGGIDSGVSDATDSLFLEVACFAPEAIAGRARRYGLNTDSSYRFERGVDPALQHRAMERATALLLELVGGQAGPVTEAVEPAALPAKAPIGLRTARIERLLGFCPPPAQVQDILARLGMQVAAGPEGWQVTPPTFRYDISMEADLIEEIGRVYGYNRLPTGACRGRLEMRPRPEARLPLQRLRALLVDRGYQEAITYSFVDADLNRAVEPELEAVPLANPLSADLSHMRTSLWPGLLKAVQHNRHRQQSRVRLFESGLRYIRHGNDISQENMIAGVLTGERLPAGWSQDTRTVDFYDAKGDVEALLALGGHDDLDWTAAAHPALHPGQSAALRRGGGVIGWLGRVHPRLAQRLEIPDQTFLFQLKLDEILEGRVPSFQKLSRFPSIRRDVAVVVDANIPSRDLAQTIREAAGPLLQELNLFDVYQGEGIETGLKSIAFGLILQDSSRTLTDEEVDAVMQAVTARLEQKFGATLRE
ncbi:MAG TPA: phenylalanine--tRNA ligase subunit beta [Gammaproteobacteria bacterium]|nr:phenylalanine--tRNA ligase subunit beta [Gammaproteobacteria bacterium]